MRVAGGSEAAEKDRSGEQRQLLVCLLDPFRELGSHLAAMLRSAGCRSYGPEMSPRDRRAEGRQEGCGVWAVEVSFKRAEETAAKARWELLGAGRGAPRQELQNARRRAEVAESIARRDSPRPSVQVSPAASPAVSPRPAPPAVSAKGRPRRDSLRSTGSQPSEKAGRGTVKWPWLRPSAAGKRRGSERTKLFLGSLSKVQLQS